MKKLSIAVALLAALSGPTWAINKCTGANGATVYQDQPCEGAKTVNLSGVGKGDPNSAGANYWSREISRLKRNDKVEAAVSGGEVFVGMNAEEARRAWGSPTKNNVSTGSYGKHEQWVYRRSGQRSQYVYVQNGVVTSVQSSE